MQVFQASTALERAVHVLIVGQMAQALMLAGADTAAEVDVVFALAQAGFGLATIKALSSGAARLAQAAMTRGAH